MMINADSLKTAARLQAIEMLLAQTYALLQTALKIPDDAVEISNGQNLEALARSAIPGLPPELSDHYAAELHDAVVRLQSMVREIRDAGRQTLSG